MMQSILPPLLLDRRIFEEKLLAGETTKLLRFKHCVYNTTALNLMGDWCGSAYAAREPKRKK